MQREIKPDDDRTIERLARLFEGAPIEYLDALSEPETQTDYQSQ